MAEVSGLSVQVSAATQRFRAGMSRAEDAAQDLSLSLRRLGAASSSAERDLDSTGRSALASSASLGVFSSSANSASLASSNLSSILLLGVAPALVAVGAALVPVVTALGGFVAIAGAITGVGLVGAFGAIATHTDELKNRFDSVVSTLQDEFGPALDVAADTLGFLLTSFQEVIPELVPAQETIQSIAGSFAEFGGEVIDSLPAFTDLAVTLADEFLPPLTDLADKYLPMLPGFVQSLVSEFRDLAPMFMDAGRALASLLPDLNEFGRVMLDEIAPVLGDITSGLEGALERFNALDSQLQSSATQAGLLAGPLLSLVSLIGGPAGVGIVGSIVAFAAAWDSNFADIRTTLQRAGGAFQRVLGDRLPPLIDELKQLWSTVRPIVEPVLDFLVETLSVGVVNALDGVLSLLTATVELLNGDFSGAWDTVTGVIERNFNRVGDLLNKWTSGAFQNYVNLVIEGVNAIGSAFDDFLGAAGLGDEFQFEEIARVDFDTDAFDPTEGVGETSRQRRERIGGAQRAVRQEVVVTSDDEKFEAFTREQADQVVTDRERRTRRNRGRNPNPR